MIDPTSSWASKWLHLSECGPARLQREADPSDAAWYLQILPTKCMAQARTHMLATTRGRVVYLRARYTCTTNCMPSRQCTTRA